MMNNNRRLLLIVAILLTDLLTGIGLGMVVGIGFTLHHSYRNSHYIKQIKYWLPSIYKNEDKPLNGRELRKNAIFIYNKLKEKSNISEMELEEIAMSTARLDTHTY